MIDRVGERFARLTITGVASYVAPGNGKTYTVYVCKCDCGNQTQVSYNNLKTGRHQSCGCLRNERCAKGRLPGESLRNRKILAYKRSALARGLEFNLSPEACSELMQGDCHYCGTPPQRVSKAKGLRGEYKFNGIDRVDNNRGYIPGNVVTSCKTCNFAKADLSAAEFDSYINRLVTYQLGRRDGNSHS